MAGQLLVSTRKGLFTLERRNGTLAVADAAFLGQPVTIAMHDPRDGSSYAGLRLGHFGCKLHRRDAGGQWQEIACPAYPPKPDDAPVVKDPMRGEEIPWKVDQLWSLAIDPSRDGGLWCGTIPGGLFHSSDRGGTWALNMPLWSHPSRGKWFAGGYDWPGIHSILTHDARPRSVILGISCGGVWRSEDAGATWANASHGMRAAYMPPELAGDPDTQDPHLVVQCRDQPDALWTQHHNGIFRTTDGGKSWREITTATPSAFGFAVAVDPADPDTAWFVPAEKDEVRIPVAARVVVTRTRDGGKSFDVLTEGLPQQHAYDLFYRHALALDPAGQTLAIGSTTGSLWFSDDRGDSWRHITAHLPPIYALTWTT